MMQHTNIIPMRIGCQAMADGINPLWLKIDTQTTFAKVARQVSVTNQQEITKTMDQVTDHTTSLVDKALVHRLKNATQNLKSP